MANLSECLCITHNCYLLLNPHNLLGSSFIIPILYMGKLSHSNTGRLAQHTFSHTQSWDLYFPCCCSITHEEWEYLTKFFYRRTHPTQGQYAGPTQSLTVSDKGTGKKMTSGDTQGCCAMCTNHWIWRMRVQKLNHVNKFSHFGERSRNFHLYCFGSCIYFLKL